VLIGADLSTLCLVSAMVAMMMACLAAALPAHGRPGAAADVATALANALHSLFHDIRVAVVASLAVYGTALGMLATSLFIVVVMFGGRIFPGLSTVLAMMEALMTLHFISP
jgi:hypothetical protein